MPVLTLTLTDADQTLASLEFDTRLDLATLLQRIPELLRPSAETGPTTSESPVKSDLSAVGRRYLPLARYLAQQTEPQVRLTFQEIDVMLDKELPPTARGEHAKVWWSNSTSHSQGAAWLTVGWRVTGLEVTDENQEVIFTRS